MKISIYVNKLKPRLKIDGKRMITFTNKSRD